jgi:hypothetical protein
MQRTMAMKDEIKQMHPSFPRKMTFGGYEKDDRKLMPMWTTVLTNEEIDEAMKLLLPKKTPALRAEDV